MKENNISRRDFLRLAAVGTLGAIAVSCSPKVEEAVVQPTTPTKSLVKLQWYSYWTTAVPGFDKFQELLGYKFADEHPDFDIKVECLPYPSGGTEAIVTGAAAGTLADVPVQQCWDIPWMADLLPLVALDDVRAKVGGDAQFTFLAKWKGKEYMNYAYGGPMVPYFNKTWLQEKGVEYPKNWDEYIPIAKKVTDKEKNQYATVMKLKDGQNFHHEFANWLLQAGGKLIDENNELTFNTKEGVTALEFMKQIDEAGITLPGTLANDTTPEREGFGAQQVAWQSYEGSWEPWIIGTMEPEFEWDTTFVPEGPGGRMSLSVGTGFSVNGGSKNIELATELCMYLTVGNGNKDWHMFWGLLPVYRPNIAPLVEKQPLFQKILDQANVGTFGLPVFDGWAEMNTALAKHEALFWDGSKSAQAALDDTIKDWKAAIARK